MPIRLFDTLARQTRDLQPADPDGVFRFYNCGPTVYAPAHIGNFRTFIVNDVLRRILDLEFPGKVRHVRNLTDVDDRTIGQARAEKRPLREITARWTALFHKDCEALCCLKPHVEPTATGNIPEQVDMIDVLMKKGNASPLAADGSVLFQDQLASRDTGRFRGSRSASSRLDQATAFDARPQGQTTVGDCALHGRPTKPRGGR